MHVCELQDVSLVLPGSSSSATGRRSLLQPASAAGPGSRVNLIWTVHSADALLRHEVGDYGSGTINFK